MNEALRQKPKFLRSSRSKSSGTTPRVERRGGYRKQGVIRGVSVITKGEALGHDLWVDDEMLEQVADGINLRNKGVKARFTHPALSGDGLGRFVGRVMDAEVIGGQVIADEHFSAAGHNTPEGDLAAYLMDLADEDPDAYGLSIVFGNDDEAMQRFVSDHTTAGVGFVSPDPENTENLPHARVASLHAVDSVDEPAANPNGLFHRDQEIAVEADSVACFALGLTDEKPATVCLGVDADRVRQFVGRFMTNHGLTLTETETVATETTEEKPADEPVEDNTEATTPDNGEEDTADAGEQAEAPQETETAVAASGREEASRFRDAFGDQGFGWFCDGVTFEDATVLYVKSLQAKNDELHKRIESLSQGEAEPVEFSAEDKPDANSKPKGLAGAIRIQGAK